MILRFAYWKLLARGDCAGPELYNLATGRPAIVERLTAKIVAFRKSLPLTPFYATAAGETEQEPDD